ncbi:hypothetical protein [Azospirillum sp.]|uniref:hypothetical protein n=1 Tax=Azospirillum sp. TaxID=34012 RepID=UPI002D320050|nr:hypothetical protein [Azospirillum sp.]HYD65530.1 hypothetical protein [Azospirillum sp.]
MITDNGTPQELAQRIGRLPDGQYRVYVQPIRSRAEVLAEFERLFATADASPDPAVAGKSDDEIMDMVNAIIEEGRSGERAKRSA